MSLHLPPPQWTVLPIRNHSLFLVQSLSAGFSTQSIPVEPRLEEAGETPTARCGAPLLRLFSMHIKGPQACQGREMPGDLEGWAQWRQWDSARRGTWKLTHSVTLWQVPDRSQDSWLCILVLLPLGLEPPPQSPRGAGAYFLEHQGWLSACPCLTLGTWWAWAAVGGGHVPEAAKHRTVNSQTERKWASHLLRARSSLSSSHLILTMPCDKSVITTWDKQGKGNREVEQGSELHSKHMAEPEAEWRSSWFRSPVPRPPALGETLKPWQHSREGQGLKIASYAPGEVARTIPFWRWGNWDLERKCNSSVATWLGSGWIS